MHRCFWGVESYFFSGVSCFVYAGEFFRMDVLEWWMGTYFEFLN